jgi:hypothetical protein
MPLIAIAATAAVARHDAKARLFLIFKHHPC